MEKINEIELSNHSNAVKSFVVKTNIVRECCSEYPSRLSNEASGYGVTRSILTKKTALKKKQRRKAMHTLENVSSFKVSYLWI